MNTRRAWIIDQLSALVRNGAVPKSDTWIQTILDWLAVHGLFIIAKKSEKSTISAVRAASSVFSFPLGLVPSWRNFLRATLTSPSVSGRLPYIRIAFSFQGRGEICECTETELVAP